MAEDGFKGNVAVIGLGLLGASLAMALKDRKVKVSGWARRNEVRQWALDKGVIDYSADDVGEVLRQADITVICLPIPEIINFIQKHANCWKAGAVVSDVGSVKQVIVAAGETALKNSGVCFVGAHPMAGTEKSGPENAFPELYDNSEVLITPTENTDATALEKLSAMWRLIGSRVNILSPAAHDELVAYTSHIPHVMSLALTQTVLECDDEQTRARRYSGCASGFRDTSRISSSSPRMWREIIEHNQTAVLEGVKQAEKNYRRLAEIIERGDFAALEAEFVRGKELRDGWLEYKNKQTGRD